MPHRDMPSRVVWDPIAKVFRVYFRGDLMHPTFSIRIDAVRYLSRLRFGRVPTSQPPVA